MVSPPCGVNPHGGDPNPAIVNTPATIIILGAGFGGITTAIRLEKQLRRRGLVRSCHIVLVDRNNYHTYTPALYEIAALPKERRAAVPLHSTHCIDIERIVRSRAVTFLQDTIESASLQLRTVTLAEHGAMPFDYLVIALGAEVNYFDIPGLPEHAYTLKHFTDAIRIRNSIEKLVRSHDELTVVVGGAGATGVELAAEFSNFLCSLQHSVRAHQNACTVRLVLIEASSGILPGFSDTIVRTATRRLNSLGVEIRVSAPIAGVNADSITFRDGSRMRCDALVWTGGIKGAASLAAFGLPLGPKGNIVVDATLAASPGIFAVGDAACFTNPNTGLTLPWNVPVAEAEAAVVADNIVRAIEKKPLKDFQPDERYPFVLTVGKKYAIADLVFLRISGLLGWMLKRLVELRYLLFILPIGTASMTWIRNVRAYISND